MTKEQAQKLLMHANSMAEQARLLLTMINENGPIDFENDSEALDHSDGIEHDAKCVIKLIDSL